MSRRAARPTVTRSQTNINVRRSVLIFSFVTSVAASAFAQATLRVGDPVEIRIGGVPQEEQKRTAMGSSALQELQTAISFSADSVPGVQVLYAEMSMWEE